MRATVANRVQIGSYLFTQDSNIDSDAGLIVDPSPAAAKTGVLTTRTDNDTGTLTMDPGHGITTGARLDVYWVGGSRTNMLVGTVAGNSVPIDAGVGDNLPSAAAAIVAMVPQLESFVLTAANVIGLYVTAPGSVRATATFRATGPTVVLSARVSADADYIWTLASGIATPLGSNLVDVYLSHDDTTQTRKVTAFAQYN